MKSGTNLSSLVKFSCIDTSFFYLSVLAIFFTSFTVVGRWFIYRKLQLIASDIYLLSLPLSLKLVVFILSAVVSWVILGYVEHCL